MSRFNADKKGYNPKEVDDYIHTLILKYEERLAEQKDRIAALKKELDITSGKLKEFEKQSDQIAKALILAVEKGQQIEDRAKSVYGAEIKRIRMLYIMWGELLHNAKDACPDEKMKKHLSGLITQFKKSMDEIAAADAKIINTTVKQSVQKKGDDYIRNILNKMDYQIKNAPMVPKEFPIEDSKTKESVAAEFKREKSRLNLINNKMQDISKKIGGKKGGNLADKFLNSDREDLIEHNAYTKNIARKTVKKAAEINPLPYDFPEPNESGFDLKEALNPKEDLDEIMKSFNFFTENGEKKKK